ncbi:hypothetical protein AB0A73_21155 [Glycomyces sp. NPDC047369]
MTRKRTRIASLSLGLLAAVALAVGPSLPAGAAVADGVAAQQSCSSVTNGPEANSGVTGKQTVRSITTSRGTIQVRSGYFNGVRYGWARVVNGAVWGIVMKVDHNGDRVVDLSCGPDGWFSGTSDMYPTSSSSDRAFKACVRADTEYTAPCNPAHQTAWW